MTIQQNLQRLPEGPLFHRGINDPEIRDLSTLLQERISSTAQARRSAAMLLTLKQMMQQDIVHFVYDKASGEQRSAYGTRAEDIITRYHGEPKAPENKSRERTTFNYFDLTRRAWRSFRPENIIDIDTNYTL